MFSQNIFRISSKLFIFSIFISTILAQELSLSARLSQPDGSPLEGVVDLRFELSYSGAPETVICTKDMTGTSLTNGLFQLGLNFSTAECGGSSLSDVLEGVPASEAMLFRVVDVTDPANPRIYPFQSLKAVPLSVRSEVAQTLARNSAVEGQVLRFVGGEWTASNETAEVGTVSEINTGAGLTGGPITSSGTIAIASGGVTSAMVADGTLVDADLSATAAIARTKIATGTANYVLVNDGSGVMSEIAILPLSSGGTGATNTADARSNLGLGNAALRNVGLLAGELLDSGEIPSCALDEKIRKVVMPVAGFICESGADATKLPLAGGTMSGNINMNANAITNLADPSLAQDAATKSYVDGQIGGGAANQWNESGGNVYRASGNVGIGTSATTLELTVINNDLISSTIDLISQRTAITAGDVLGGIDFSSNDSQKTSPVASASIQAVAEINSHIATNHPTALIFKTSANLNPAVTEKMRISASGNVGIGTASPQTKLHVAAASPVALLSSTTTNSYLRFDTTSATQAMIGSENGRLKFQPNSTTGESLTISSVGNVGIGVLTPAAKLDVNGQIKISGGSPGAGKVLTSDASGLATWVAPSTTATPTGAASGDLAGNYPGPVIAPGAVTDAKVAAGANIAQSKIANLSTDLAAKQAADDDLTGLSNLATNGVMVRTGSGTYQTRALDGVANRTVVTNADGVTGNPTINVSTSLLPSPLAGDATRFLRATGANTTSWQALLGADITTALGYTPINKAGDSIGSGVFDFNSTAVVRTNNPVGTRDVANKSYVDTQVSSAANQWTAAGGNVYRASGNVGIGTNSPDAKLEVVGNLLSSNNRSYLISRATPVAVDDFVELGRFSYGNRGYNLKIDLIYDRPSVAVAKTYLVPVRYFPSENWFKLMPTAQSIWGTDDFSIDIRPGTFSTSHLILRLRRTSGSLNGTVQIRIEQLGYVSTSFEELTATGTAVEPSSYFEATSLTQVEGRVGVGIEKPQKQIHMHSAGNDNYLQITSSLTGDTVLDGFLIGTGTAGDAAIYNRENTNMLFFTNNTEQARISNEGNMSLGGGFPNLGGNSLNSRVLTIKGSGIDGPADGRIEFVNPKTNVQVNDSPGRMLFHLPNNGAVSSSKNIAQIGVLASGAGGADGLGGTIRFHTRPNNSTVSISDPSTVRLMINEQGNVGLGTLTPEAPLVIQGNGASGSGQLILRDPSSPTGASSRGPHMFFDNADGEKGWLGFFDAPVHGNGTQFNLRSFTGPINIAASSTANHLYIGTDGNIGVGTTNPENLNSWNRVFDTYGAAHSKVTASSSNVNMSMNAHNTGFYGAPAGGLLGTLSNHPVSLYTNAQSRMTITNTGLVGIGTNAPTSSLDINGTLRIRGGAPGAGKVLTSDSNGNATWGSVSGSSPWSLSGSDVYYNSGNVGISTSAPGSALEVVGPVSVSAFTGNSRFGLGIGGSNGLNTLSGIDFLGTSSSPINPKARIAMKDTIGGTFLIFGTSSNKINGITNEALTINPFSRVGINNGNPIYDLDVLGDINSSTSLRVAGTQVCTSAGCTTASDERLKENINPLNDSLEFLLSLQGVEYDYIDREKFGNQRQIGFIAQDVENIFPEVVRTDPQSGIKSIAYSLLVAPIIEAIKTMNTKISKLEGSQIQQNREISSKVSRDEYELLKKENEMLKISDREKAQQIVELNKRLERIERVVELNKK